MNAGEALLQHARVDAHARSLAADIARLREALESSAAVDAATVRVDEARALQQQVAARLRERDREVAEHRARMQQRDRELMSGRINNPTELTKLSAEVEHMKARIADEEEAELELMEEAERAEVATRSAEAALEAARAEVDQAAPEMRARLDRLRAELSGVEADRDRLWDAVPADYRAAAARIRALPPVAEAGNGQCGACHVQLTSSAIQALRRAELRTCDNCGRILVMG